MVRTYTSDTVKTYIGNIGTRYRLKLQADISGIDHAYVILYKPDGSGYQKTAIVETYSPTGYIYYDTTSGDLNFTGELKGQGLVTWPNGNYLHSETFFDKIYPLGG